MTSNETVQSRKESFSEPFFMAFPVMWSILLRASASKSTEIRASEARLKNFNHYRKFLSVEHKQQNLQNKQNDFFYWVHFFCFSRAGQVLLNHDLVLRTLSSPWPPLACFLLQKTCFLAIRVWPRAPHRKSISMKPPWELRQVTRRLFWSRTPMFWGFPWHAASVL